MTKKQTSHDPVPLGLRLQQCKSKPLTHIDLTDLRMAHSAITNACEAFDLVLTDVEIKAHMPGAVQYMAEPRAKLELATKFIEDVIARYGRRIGRLALDELAERE